MGVPCDGGGGDGSQEIRSPCFQMLVNYLRAQPMRALQNRHGHFAALEDPVPSKSDRLEGYSKGKSVKTLEANSQRKSC